MVNNLARLSVEMVMLALPMILIRRRMALVGLMTTEDIEAPLHLDLEEVAEDRAMVPTDLKI
jgi:hypothetical protein